MAEIMPRWSRDPVPRFTKETQFNLETRPNMRAWQLMESSSLALACSTSFKLIANVFVE